MASPCKVVVYYPKGRVVEGRVVASALRNMGYDVLGVREYGGDKVRILHDGKVVEENDMIGWINIYVQARECVARSR